MKNHHRKRYMQKFKKIIKTKTAENNGNISETINK